MEMALDDPSDRPEGTRSFNEALSRITFARCPPFPADVFHMVLADYKATMLMLSEERTRKPERVPSPPPTPFPAATTTGTDGRTHTRRKPRRGGMTALAAMEASARR